MQKVRTFFRRLFLTVGFAVVMISLLGWTIGYIRYQKSLHLPENIVLKLDLTQPLAEQSNGSGLPFVGGAPSIGTADMVRVIDRARLDHRVKVLVGTFGNAEPPLADAQELRAALNRFAESGKKMVAYAPSFGEMTAGDKSFYIASQFGEINVQPTGLVGLSGIGLQMPFIRGLLDQYNIKPDVYTRKAYKTAMASATDKTFTPEHRLMMDQLLDSVYAQLVEGIATGRKLPPETVKSLINRGPLNAQEALDAKLIDHIAYEDDVMDKAKEAATGSTGIKSKIIGWTDYGYVISQRMPKEVPQTAPDDKTIAIIHIDGMIHSGESVQGPMGGNYETSGADTIVEALNSAREDKKVAAAILRIDSPGGSAVASETIRRAVVRLNEKKPVIVSMGATAASGGYWIATGAKTIIADPATLTGSIGVLAGKFTIGDLLKRFNINIETMQRGDHAAMWSMTQPFDENEKAKLNKLLDDVYDNFKARVGEARGLDAAAVEKIAQGRVWTGQQAKDLKLVDELGGLDIAVMRAKEKIGVDVNTPAYVQNLPQAPSRADQIRNLLEMMMSGSTMIGKISGVFTYMNMPQGSTMMPTLLIK